MPSSHPFVSYPHYSEILADCLTIVFSYHIQHIFCDISELSESDVIFCRQFIHSWEFARHVNVREFLQETRGNKAKLEYVGAKHNFSLDNETFKLFRGIKDLNVARRWNLKGPGFTDEALENLRGIETLDISFCSSITSEGFVNLRGIKNLDIQGMYQLNDSALEQLRGIQTLNMSSCTGFTNYSMKNLRGIQHLDISHCKQLADICFENFRGVRSLRMVGCSELITSACFDDLRGIKSLCIPYGKQFSGDSLKELIGVQELDIDECPQITDDHLQYLVGVKKLDICKCPGITAAGLQYVRGVQDISFCSGSLTSHDDFSPLHEARHVCLSDFTITTEMIKNFRLARTFTAWDCIFNSDSLFSNLANVENLRLYNANLDGVTDEAFGYLCNLRKLKMVDCTGGDFTKDLFEYLPPFLEKFHYVGENITLHAEDVQDVVYLLANVSVLRVPVEYDVWDFVLEEWLLYHGW